MTPGLSSYFGVLVWKNAISDGGNLSSSSVPSLAWGEETKPEQHMVLPSDSRGALGLAITPHTKTRDESPSLPRCEEAGIQMFPGLTHFHAQSLGTQGASFWCGSAGAEGGSSASVPGSPCHYLPPLPLPLLDTGSSCCISSARWPQSRTLRC